MNGVTYRGVAVVWDESKCTLKKLDNRAGGYEILACSGKIKGHSRKLVAIACYLPPGYTKKKGEEAMEELADMIVDLKRRFADPFLVIEGDFNQWKVEDCLLDFPDLKEADVGYTRNSKRTDRLFTNLSRSIDESGTLDPLENEDGTKRSNHRIAYCRMQLARMKTFKWHKFTYRHFNSESVKAFREWVVFHEWKEVLEAVGSNKKADAYQRTICAALDRFFPWKTTRRKSNEHPWMNKRVKKMIKDRRDLFWEEGGRTEVWKEKKKEVAKKILERKRGYMDTQKEHILDADANRNFFKHVKNFSRFEPPEQFDIRSLLPGKNDNDVGEALADYFIQVSKEFDPLEPADIPSKKPAGGAVLERFEVAARLKKMRKPKSMVPGDIFPQLVTDYSDFLAIPLTSIYNEILSTYV